MTNLLGTSRITDVIFIPTLENSGTASCMKLYLIHARSVARIAGMTKTYPKNPDGLTVIYNKPIVVKNVRYPASIIPNFHDFLAYIFTIRTCLLDHEINDPIVSSQ